MNSRTRSPNYPSISLGEAIEAIRKVYAHERRSQFPRKSLAAHLGYSSINGRSLAKIGAIRAYNLIEGREDALRVSHTAVAILEAPDNSRDKTEAYRAAFLGPTIFQKAYEEYGALPPSPQTFRWWLTNQGYVGDAADRAMQNYLESLDLLNSIGAENPSRSEEPAPAAAEPQWRETSSMAEPREKAHTRIANADSSGAEPDFKIKLGEGRWLLIEIKGGEPRNSDFLKLEKFARFQRELLEDDDSESADD